MRVALAAFGLIALLLTAPQPLLAEDAPPIRTITLSGTGEVRARPDMATILLGVVQQGGTAGEALRANSEAMTKVLDTLKSLGIAEKDIQTANFTISPRYDYGPNNQGPAKITGYEVSNQVAVSVRALPKLGGLLDEIVRVGSNQVSSVSFGLTDPKPLEDVARERAVADARRKADIYAAAAGIQIGPIQSIGEATFAPPVPIYAKQMRADAAASVPIAEGELVIQANVTIVWQIK